MISTFPSIIRYMSIGARLEELRRASQLTQQQMADIVGTTKQYVGRLEKGLNQTPNGVFLTEWARYFAVSPRWLSTGEGSRTVTGATPSHPERPDFGKLASAVTVLRHYLEIMGDPAEWVSDPILLEAAFEVVEEFGGSEPASNVIDLTKILARKIRGATDGQGQQVRRVGAASGG